MQWIEPLLNRALAAVTIQDQSRQLKFENVLTHDNVRLILIVNLVERIPEEGVRAFIIEVEDPTRALVARANSAVAEAVASQPLDTILSDRAGVSRAIQALLVGEVAHWGYEIRAIEIVDLKVADEEIERAMALRARAEKEAQAELQRAKMQVEIAQHLKDAAAVMDDSAWRLKGLETLTELTRSAQNNTVLVPTELLGALTALGIKTR